MEQERIVFLDWMRAIACLMVLTVHSCECFYMPGGDVFDFGGPATRWSVLLYNSFVRPSAVPLFIMISSYLLLPLKTDTFTFYKRRAKRVLIPFLVFLVLYGTLPALWDEFTLAEVGANLKALCTNFIGNEGHLWFVYVILGLYLIMPVISPWLERASKKEEGALLLVWLFTMCFFRLRTWFGPIFGECSWNEFATFYYVSGYVGYVVLAHYIRKYVSWSDKKTFAVCIPLFLATFAWSVWRVNADSYVATNLTDLEVGWQNHTVMAAINTFAAFMMLSRIRGCARFDGFVRKLSEASYGMYLMHMFFLPVICSLWVKVLPVCFAIPATALTTYFVTFLISRGISKIPGGRYIVG